MPSYLYKCSDCGAEATVVHGFDGLPDPCGVCGSTNMTKAYNASAPLRPVAESFLASKKAGKKVQEHIEQSKQSLRDTKTDKRR